MGRKERRDAERRAREEYKSSQKHLTKNSYTKEEVTLAVNNLLVKKGMEIQKQARQHAIRDLCAVMIETLMDELGFGQTRVLRFIRRANLKLSCIEKGLVTIDDIVNNWEEALDIEQEEFYKKTEV